jgi:hypothetical protein
VWPPHWAHRSSLTSSSVFLSDVLWFSVYKSHTSFIRFIPGYCMLFYANVNYIVFKISLSSPCPNAKTLDRYLIITDKLRAHIRTVL